MGDNIDIIYILDIDGIVSTPQVDSTTSKSVGDEPSEHSWIEEVKNVIISLYTLIFTLNSQSPPVTSSSTPLSSHPLHNGKLFVLISLSCAALFRHVIPSIPWFTGWLSSPLVPSSIISLLCGKYSSDFQFCSELPDMSAKNQVEEIKAYRILVAEDNTANCLVLKRLISRIRNDIHIEWAKTGTEVVQKFVNSLNSMPYDLCFMDLEMPKLNGYDAAKAIRESERIHRVQNVLPIVAVSANDTANLSVRELCNNAGMNDSISKPIDKNLLSN